MVNCDYLYSLMGKAVYPECLGKMRKGMHKMDIDSKMAKVAAEYIYDYCWRSSCGPECIFYRRGRPGDCILGSQFDEMVMLPRMWPVGLMDNGKE